MVGNVQVMKRATVALVFALGLLATAAAQEGPDRDAFGPAQSAADIVRSTAYADIALLPAGMMNRDFEGTDLTKLVRYPGDSIVVAKLTGAQLLAALNRSISLYPSPNSGFLQLSGIEVTFDPDKAPNERVVSVTVGDSKLDEATEYEVAMPISLARGGYGYSSIWDKKVIVRNLEPVTLESALKGKRADEQSPRWKKSG